MTALVWDDIKARMYEAGVERGVLYPSDGPGVVWNGLLSVSENLVGGERKSYAENGVTYLNSVASRTYQATVRAFSAPEEFGPCVGDLEVLPGFTLTRQPRKQFGFSYRTSIADSGYKIHLVYNALATPTSRSYASTNSSPTPTNLEWTIDATPVEIPGLKPTAHLIIDSTKVNSAALSSLEQALYGSDTSTPYLPAASVVINTLQAIDVITALIEGVI